MKDKKKIFKNKFHNMLKLLNIFNNQKNIFKKNVKIMLGCRAFWKKKIFRKAN